MSRGRRYDDEPKLNLKKVFGTIIVLAVIVTIIITINNILNKKAELICFLLVKISVYYVI